MCKSLIIHEESITFSLYSTSIVIIILSILRNILQELETVVGSLLVTEVDRDVSAAISATITQLDKIEVCESQVLNLL